MGSSDYGRGKFKAHNNYISYMQKTIITPPYDTIPHLKTKDHINWQVSSGKTTSFYKYYKDRWSWWEKMANKLGVAGSGNSGERFTITARLIHPTKFKPCRLCGNNRSVGYFYLNKNAVKKIVREYGENFSYLTGLDEVLKKRNDIFLDLFSEYGKTDTDLKKNIHVRHKLLSPGYMGNPPDRLDGFHDYCVYCRQKNDPGRSKENMSLYSVDRRTFTYWVEGNWKKADQLFNSAGSGECKVCKKKVAKISPDHIGPLSCGFKHMPLFNPMCRSCNSSKGRRMSFEDVITLIAYETSRKKSVASRQIKKYWDQKKNLVKNDRDALFLSNRLRLLQHYWLHAIGYFIKEGYKDELLGFIETDYALYDYVFNDLDSSSLSFSSSTRNEVNSTLREGQKDRVLRISCDAALDYIKKENRKIVDSALFEGFYENFISRATRIINKDNTEDVRILFTKNFNLFVEDVLNNDPSCLKEHLPQ